MDLNKWMVKYMVQSIRYSGTIISVKKGECIYNVYFISFHCFSLESGIPSKWQEIYIRCIVSPVTHFREIDGPFWYAIRNGWHAINSPLLSLKPHSPAGDSVFPYLNTMNFFRHSALPLKDQPCQVSDRLDKWSPFYRQLRMGS